MSDQDSSRMQDRSPADPVETVLDALRRHGAEPVVHGKNWSAHCPAHEDKTPSLSVSTGDGGRALLYCHAGCPYGEIVRALGLDVSELFAQGRQASRHETPYLIRDRNGTVLARHIRIEIVGEPKRFVWARPNGRPGLGEMRAADLPLYGTERLKDWPTDEPIILVEGEKAADALIRRGFHALATVTGAAGCPNTGPLEILRARKVVLWPDADGPGTQHMARVGKALAGIATEVRVFCWSDAPRAADAHDFFATGNDAEARAQVGLASAESFGDWIVRRPEASKNDASPEAIKTPGSAPTSTPNEDHGFASQASRMAALIEDLELFQTPDGHAYAIVEHLGHREPLAVRQASFGRWLGAAWYRRYGTMPKSATIHDAIALIDARASDNGRLERIHTRVAEHAGKIYIDLNNAERQTVEVSSSGWRVLEQYPIFFRRTRGMCALPVPVRGCNLELLRQLINLPNDGDWQLAASWMLAALRPTGPYPVLVLQGEQGSAKSTTARMMRALVDPSSAPLRSEPPSIRDLMIGATNCWVQAFDNISRIPPWLSDALCRLSTGGAFATRQLYSDSEETIFDAQRPVLLNGIEDLATRSDLLDRCIVLTLPAIADSRRRSEREIWFEFEAIRPALFARLLNALSLALRDVHEVVPALQPRMADFACWAQAGAPALGWTAESFRDAYASNRSLAHEIALESGPIGPALRDLLEARGSWEGTAAELLHELIAIVPEAEFRRAGWPRTPLQLSNQLSRIQPNLRAFGVDVDRRRAHRGRRLISITRLSSDSVSDVSGVSNYSNSTSNDELNVIGEGEVETLPLVSKPERLPGSEVVSALTHDPACDSDGGDDGDAFAGSTGLVHLDDTSPVQGSLVGRDQDDQGFTGPSTAPN